MTVTYSLHVATSSFLCFYKLLFRWKGSLWKGVWAELLLWLVVYTILSVTYRVFLRKDQRETFENICVFCDTYSSFIPITFMLGFYVSTVFTRWWEVFNNMGFIDTQSLLISQYVLGTDDHARMLRRTCIRYLVLTQALVFRDISTSVRKRFPTVDHLVTAGLLSSEEMKEIDAVVSPHAKYWQPLSWIFAHLKIARAKGMLPGEVTYARLIDSLNQFRAQTIKMLLFDWVSVPLVYTQVVHLTVHSYFFMALFGRQYLTTDRNIPKQPLDLYVPIISILQFIFFTGWLKVAEVLLNPLGEDDDDFECNWVLDRNLQVGFCVVDDAHDRHPPLQKDHFWEDRDPQLLYTIETANRTVNNNIGSCAEMPVTEKSDWMFRRRNPSRQSGRGENEIDSEAVSVPTLHRQHELSPVPPSGRLSEMMERIRGGRRASGASSIASDRPRYDRNDSMNLEANYPTRLARLSESESISKSDESTVIPSRGYKSDDEDWQKSGPANVAWKPEDPNVNEDMIQNKENWDAPEIPARIGAIRNSSCGKVRQKNF